MDEYTEKLLERSKARKDFLKSKLTERKRRTVLSDENEENLSNAELPHCNDDSPKRQCLDSDVVQNLENKENSSDLSYVPFIASEKKGLAALRKNKKSSNELEEQSIPTINVTEAEESQGFVKSPSTTKITYSFLKKDNDQDDLLSGEEMDQDEINDRSFEGETKTDILSSTEGDFLEDFSESRISPIHQQSPRNLEFASSPVRLQSPSEIASLISPRKFRSPQKTPPVISPVKFRSPQRSPQKIESVASLTQHYTPQKKEAVCKSISAKVSPHVKFTKQDKADFTDSSKKEEEEVDPADLPLSARKALFERALFNTPVSTKSGSEVNLSVAQRASLFEKGGLTEQQKKSQAELRKSLSAPAPTKTEANSTQKPESSPQFASFFSTNENKIAKMPTPSPVNSPKSPGKSSVLSPSKNAGVHTRLVQQRLIDNSNSDWRNKDIVAKATEERKTEISSLLRHWENVINSESITSETSHRPNKVVSFISNTKDPVFTTKQDSTFITKEDSAFVTKEDSVSTNKKSVLTNEDDCTLIREHIIDKEEDSEHGYESENEESQESDTFEISSIPENSDDNVSENFSFTQKNEEKSNLTLSEHDDLSMQTSADLSNDVVAVCNEINEVLDEAVRRKRTPYPIMSSLSSSQDQDISYTSSSGSSLSSSSSFSKQESSYKPDVKEEIPVFTNGDSNSAPVHTISFYRKQKQQIRATPVQTIVRKEKVASPPSPEIDNSKIIQEKIKSLQMDKCSQEIVISQTSQALNLCHATQEFFGSTEQVECERLLLIATQKRQALLNEIHRLKTHGALGEKLEDGSGMIVIHDIELPLKREFIASQLQSKGGGDTVHYFLCLLRHGPQVVVTQMLSTVPSEVTNGSLCFSNHITLHNLSPDFSIVFEVYALQTKKEVLPHEKKYHIKKDHSKIRLTPKSKKSDSKLHMPIISSPGGPSAVRSPSFGVVGFTRFVLQNHGKRSFTLDRVPFSSPLAGILSVKMQLHVEYNIAERGFLTMFDDVSGFGAWHRRWCVLHNCNLSFWKYPDDEKKKAPVLQLDLRQCSTNQVKLVAREICARQHTFELMISRPSTKEDKNTLTTESRDKFTKIQYLLAADTKEERILWCKRLNESLTTIRRWNPEPIRHIEIQK